MKILIAAALFPPDVAVPAPYLKELAKRLGEGHEVTVLAYGHIPEATPAVTIVTVAKQQSTIKRLLEFTVKLYRLTKTHDVVLVQNGAATELPAILVALRYRPKIWLQASDPKVDNAAAGSLVISLLHKLARQIISKQLTLTYPPPRPEILPFQPAPAAAEAVFEASWTDHLVNLENQISHHD